MPIQFESTGSGIPLLLLHGFTGSGTSWQEVRELLGEGWRVITPDVRGHGGSRLTPDALCTMDTATADLLLLLDTLGVQRAVVAGYSMGGRLALHFALTLPWRVAALILEGASPGIADDGERAARRAADEELAASIERDGVAAFVERWTAQPLFATQQRLPPERLAVERSIRLSQDPAGLAASLRGMGAGAQPAHWGRLHELRMPVLLMAGAEDEKYADLAAQMGRKIPDKKVFLVTGAGHAAHLEDPVAFVEALRGFLGVR